MDQPCEDTARRIRKSPGPEVLANSIDSYIRLYMSPAEYTSRREMVYSERVTIDRPVCGDRLAVFVLETRAIVGVARG